MFNDKRSKKVVFVSHCILNQNTKLDARMLLMSIVLWILMGTISFGLIWAKIVSSVSKMDSYEAGLIVGLGFILGGILGGIFGRFTTRYLATRWQKKGWVFSLTGPILVIGPVLVQILLREALFLLFLGIVGILGFSYVVWIPRLIKSSWRRFRGAWWVVVVALTLIILNTLVILFLLLGMMGQ